MRETSLAAYRAARDKGILSKRRYQIIWAMHGRGPMTLGEIYQKIVSGMRQRQIQKIPPQHSFNPRMAELADYGMVVEVCHRPCTVTGVVCIAWALTGIIPEHPVKRRAAASDERCPTCHRPWRRTHGDQ